MSELGEVRRAQQQSLLRALSAGRLLQGRSGLPAPFAPRRTRGRPQPTILVTPPVGETITVEATSRDGSGRLLWTQAPGPRRAGFDAVTSFPTTKLTVSENAYYTFDLEAFTLETEGGANVDVHAGSLIRELADPGARASEELDPVTVPLGLIDAGTPVSMVSDEPIAYARATLQLVDVPAGRTDDPVATACPVFGILGVVQDDGFYNAFPGLAVAANGDYVLAYRKGTSHTSNNGNIRVRRSSNQGATWSAETTPVLAYVNDGYDYRGARLSRVGDGTMVMVASRASGSGSWGTKVLGGSVTLTSADHGVTWSSPTTVGTNFTAWDLSEAVLTVLGDGSWLLPVWGKDTGDTGWSVRLFRSTDDGATWTLRSTIADGSSSGVLYNETGLVKADDGTLIAIVRRDPDGVSLGDQWLIRRSTDDGLTWSALETLFTATGGHPTPMRRANGDLVALRRDLANGWQATVVRSGDNGATWADCSTFASSGKSMYGQFAEESDGTLGVALAYEFSSRNSDVFFTKADA